MRAALILTLALALAACKEDEVAPGPVAMTDEALGHYCQMYVADHPGPKAQVRLQGYPEPVWFSQVSDAAAFRFDAERPAPIVAVYVSDMGAAESWAVPGASNWIEARAAHFVIDSEQAGGMGLPEAIPFGTEAAALAYAVDHGGRVVVWDGIPEGYARTPGDDGEIGAPQEHSGHQVHAANEGAGQ